MKLSPHIRSLGNLIAQLTSPEMVDFISKDK